MDEQSRALYETPTEREVTAKDSLIHVGSLDSFDITKGGIKAGKLILKYLENGSEKNLTQAAARSTAAKRRRFRVRKPRRRERSVFTVVADTN